MPLFILGSGVASVFPSMIFILLVGCLGFCCYRNWLWMFFMLGGLWVSSSWQFREAQALPLTSIPVKTELTGEISALQTTKFGLNFDITVKSSGLSALLIGGKRYRVSCYRCELPLNNGETWTLSLRIKPISYFANPGGFNYRQWSIARGYSAQGSVINKHRGRHLKINDGRIWSKTLTQIRQSVRQSVEVIDDSGLRFIKALILGDKTALQADDKRQLQRLGLSHLFVVSGLHIGLASMAAAWLVGLLIRPLLLLGYVRILPVQILVGLGSGVLYTIVSGFQVPAMRALIMISVAAYAMLAKKNISPMSLWLMALSILLILDPLILFNMGAVLSFFIVLVLIWAFWGVSLPSKYFTLLKSQYSAFLAGAIVLTAYNQSVSLLSIPINLVLVPLFSLFVLPLALAGVLLAWFGEKALLVVSSKILSALMGQIELISSVNVLALPVYQENQWLWVMGLLVITVAIGRSYKILGAVLLVTAWLTPPTKLNYGLARMTILDVGQGTSVVIQTRHHTVIFDTGRSFGSGMTVADYVLIPFLRYKGINTIDSLHLSHSDDDHNGGEGVLNQWGPAIIETIRQENCHSKRWSWDGVDFWRFQSPSFNVGNNGSCLLKVSTPGGSVLLTGDIERQAEIEIRATWPDQLRADVLLVAHHGSKTSTTASFLNVVDPQVAVISAGRNNRYRHPHGSIVARLEAANVEVLSTFAHGAIEVDIGPGHGELSVSPYRP